MTNVKFKLTSRNRKKLLRRFLELLSWFTAAAAAFPPLMGRDKFPLLWVVKVNSAYGTITRNIERRTIRIFRSIADIKTEIEAKCSRGNIYVYSACYGSLFRWDLKYRDQILDRSPANHPIEAGAEMINISKISPPPILLINFGIKN